MIPPWTEAAGITVQEAAWIQPTYEFCVNTNFVNAPDTANCGDDIEVHVKALECEPVAYKWSLFRNEKLSENDIFESNVTSQNYTIPNPTLDGERFTFNVITEYDDGMDGISSKTTHTITVSCDGQDTSPPKKAVPIYEDMSRSDMGTSDSGTNPISDGSKKEDAGCSSTGSKNSLWLILGGLFLFGLRGKKDSTKSIS